MKYTLIKTYPGSPKLGYISIPKFENQVNAHYWQSQYFEPSEYPEFWKEVIEPKFWYGVDNNFIKLKTTLPYSYQNGLYKFFESESDRDRYIKENQPKYSEKDLFDCVKYIGSAIHSMSLGSSAVDNWIKNIKK